jgi:hypothetical protein
MSLLTRSTLASLDINQQHQIVAGLLAGEALDVCAPCYIKSSDGLVYMSNGTSANEAAEVVGFTARATAIGQPVTLFGPGSRFKYSDSLLTPGDAYYLGATAGRLDTGATTGDGFGYAFALTATDIVILRVRHGLISATIGAGTVGATELAADAVETAKILNANVTQAKLEVGAAGAGLTGLVMKFVASGNVVGGIPVVHHILMVAGANGDTDITITHKTRVIAVIVHPRTTVASAAVTVKNVTNAITDAIAAVTAGAFTLCASLAVAYDTVGAGTVLRATGSGGLTQPDCDVYVIGLRVA